MLHTEGLSNQMWEAASNAISSTVLKVSVCMASNSEKELPICKMSCSNFEQQ